MDSTVEQVVDPNDYCDFVFRGEGQANFVIGVKHKASGVRSVWRFAKIHRTPFISVQPNCEVIKDYMDKIITPLLGPKYLPEMKLLKFDIIDVHHLGKLANLPKNTGVEEFEYFKTLLPKDSALRLSDVVNLQNGDYRQVEDANTIVAFQMVDATQLPPLAVEVGVDNPVLTIEIKPKQGFFQHHEGVDTNLCQTCTLMMEKVYGQQKFSRLSHFCPILLYSGEYHKTIGAIWALFEEPHRNLKIFRDGKVIHSDEIYVEDEDMSEVLFPNGNGEKDDLIRAIALLLTDSPSVEEFSLHPQSVLDQILTAQRIDEIGIIKAHQLYNELNTAVQESLLDKSMLTKIELESVLTGNNTGECLEIGSKDDHLGRLYKYFLAATLKDCSIMISLRLLNSLPVEGSSENIIQLPNGKLFQYLIKIVDLDPKEAKNLTSGFKRFTTGVKLYKEHVEEIKMRGYHSDCNL